MQRGMNALEGFLHPVEVSDKTIFSSFHLVLQSQDMQHDVLIAGTAGQLAKEMFIKDRLQKVGNKDLDFFDKVKKTEAEDHAGKQQKT